MIKSFKWLSLLLFLFPLFAWSASPSVVLKDLGGKDRNVNEFIGKGKWTVVAIWAHDCVICNQEIHQMTFFHDAHKEKDAIVLGVSIDGYANKADALKFIDKHGLNFTNLIGGPESVAQFHAGRFIGTPTFYIYSPEGALLATKVGAMTQEEVEDFINKKTNGKKV
ncbi:MAG TPA: TlpA disulfide reductase family protein [Acidiferrobacterales bacterium]|nr:TlpA disulfide reductase family protein [Acidiferrobacterales bacterium]